MTPTPYAPKWCTETCCSPRLDSGWYPRAVVPWDSLITRLVPAGWSHWQNEPSEDAGVQPLGHGCENITLHPGLVEVTPILSEHYPLNLAFRLERPKACIAYLQRYPLIRVIMPCREKFWGREVCHWLWPLCKLVSHLTWAGYKMFCIPRIYVMHGGVSVLQHPDSSTR